MKFRDLFNSDVIEGNEVDYFSRWAKRKNRSILIRSYLSLMLAITLVVLAFGREIIDIFYNDAIESIPWLHWVWRVFLVFLLIATAYTAYWEIRGDKLDVSEQEKRFLIGMRNLLAEIEKLKRELNKATKTEEVDSLMESFVTEFLATASNTLCGNNTVHAGLMFHDQNDNSLTLFYSTPDSGYIPFTILLAEVESEQIGPAQMAFEKNLLAHMPKKSKKIGWLYRQSKTDNKYLFDEFIRGWYEVPPANSDVFESVLSVPIASYAKKGKKAYHGVLNFTTAKKDHFIPRDYSMAYCFASIIAQAKDSARIKINQILNISDNQL